MPELLDFLRDFDEAFRSRARLASLYSDFRFQKTSNPDGYQANSATWTRALAKATQGGLVPGPSSGLSRNVFVLHSGEELAKALQTQEYGRPLALGAAIEDAARKKEFIQLKDFLDAKQSVYAASWIPTPWQIVTWTLKQLGMMRDQSQTDRLVAADFVVMANVEAAAKAILDQASKIATSNTSRIFTKELFVSTFASATGAENLSTTDLQVLLTHLSRDRSAISWSPSSDTIKIKAPTESHPTPITDEDISIAKLRALISSLEPQIDSLTTQIASCDRRAREAVTAKQLPTAKAALRSKKNLEYTLEKRHATLSQLEEVYARIEQAADQVELVRVMEASSLTLKSLNKQTGGVEKVQDVVEGLQEEMMNTEEIGTAITEVSAGEIDEGEVEDELAALEGAEREKREAEEAKVREREEAAAREAREKREAEEAEETRKKFAELDKMVEAGTPVGEKQESETSANTAEAATS